MLRSDIKLLSTPPPSDKAVFSDGPKDVSSPPSSPPGFPWEQRNDDDDRTETSPAPAMNAFSVLGKRKALKSISDNACPSKKQGRLSSRREATSLTQMQISLGQEVQKKCKKCGMEYVSSSIEDRKLHDKYHKQNTEGFEVGKDFVRKSRAHTVFEGAMSGDRICVIDRNDTYARRKKALAALEIVQRELGAVSIPEKQIWGVKGADLPPDHTEPRCKAYMYIRDNKCVGFLLVERIAEAQRVVAPPASAAEKAELRSKSSMSAMEALKARKRAEEGVLARTASCPIHLSTTKYPASMGVSRLWTSPTHRHQNVATTLLDTALADHNQRAKRSQRLEVEHGELSVYPRTALVGQLELPRYDGGKENLAFSQPTEAGARLARKWFGKTYGWMVYID